MNSDSDTMRRDWYGSAVDGATHAILRQVESLGHAVSVHRVNGMIEMHAVMLADPDRQFVARSADGDGDRDTYLAACALAEMVGIDLEDG